MIQEVKRPYLVTLYGEKYDISQVLSGEDLSYFKSTSVLTSGDIDYLNNKYPELMGFWSLIAKGAGKLIRAGARGIGKIRELRKRRAESRAQQAQAQQVQAQTQRSKVLKPVTKSKSIDNKTLLIIGAMGIVALMFLSRSK